MKYLVIYSHPNKASFNNVIRETVIETLEKNGHEIKVRDLYENNFNPVLSASDFETFLSGGTPDDIKAEQEYIKWAEKIIFISPIWWASFPAILKGYIDKIFSYGFAYLYDENGPVPLLTDKEGIFISTMGAPNEFYKEAGFLDSFDKTQDIGILNFTGIKSGEHIFFGAVPTTTDEIRKGYLEEVTTALKKFWL